MNFDAVIVGGGIVGAACAAEFARAGLKTAVIERGEIGGGATAAGMGHLAVMDDSEAQFALTRYSQLLWKELAERLPTAAEYLPCGAIWVAADDEEMAEVHRKQRFFTERGAPVEVLDSAALAEAEPQLRPGLAGGLLVKDDGVVYPPRAAKFLLEEARVTVIRDSAIQAGGGTVKLQGGEVIHAPCIVAATGSVAAQLIPAVRVQPRKGHLLITDRYPGFLRHQLIELGYLKSAHASGADSIAFNVQPRLTGQLLIGSSRQYGVTDPAIETHMMNAMLARALEYMPALANVSAIRGWTGFRAATPDKLPLIGRCPGREDLFVATGHEGLGISTSLATGRLLVDIVLNRESAIPREPYSPDRVC